MCRQPNDQCAFQREIGLLPNDEATRPFANHRFEPNPDFTFAVRADHDQFPAKCPRGLPGVLDDPRDIGIRRVRQQREREGRRNQLVQQLNALGSQLVGKKSARSRRNWHRQLLRSRRERPACRRTAEKRDELPALHATSPREAELRRSRYQFSVQVARKLAPQLCLPCEVISMHDRAPIVGLLYPP
jgi:hypothetical protein